MPTLQELRDKRGAAIASAKEYKAKLDAGETLTGEDHEAWDRALNDVDTVGVEIANEERSAALDERFGEIDTETTDVLGGDGAAAEADRAYREAFVQFARHGMNDCTPEQRQLLMQNRAQSEGIGAAGGYTVPTGFWAKVTETQKYFGGAMEGAEVINTDSGQNLPWPTNDDTANEGYQLGENTEAVEPNDLEFGQKELGAYTYVSGPIKASIQLIQDSGIDIEAFIARRMGERIGRIENRRFTTGVGGIQPQGYITGLTTGVTTAGATAITYNELVDLIHSVDAAYRASGRCRFKLHDLVLAYVRKIRDDSGGAGLGRPIWEPSVQAGVPDLLLGYPYTINNHQDSTVAASKKVMAFGDFNSAFVIRKVNGAAMKRLEERYADFLQVGFIGFERADSLVQDSSAAKLLVQHA